MSDLRILERDTVFTNEWGQVRRCLVEDAAGRESTYAYMDRRDGVVVVASCGDLILFVAQKRLPIGITTWELPSGAVEGEESVVDAASRELREECGLELLHHREVGVFAEAPAYSTVRLHIVRGKVQSPTMREQANSNEIEGMRLLSIADFKGLVASGITTDGATLAALALSGAWGEGVIRGPELPETTGDPSSNGL